ncbi:peptide chain release factor N(5)-glutamine methyltransferase [Synoicihabitans lomoniglobus]|uniref:Release factor glutamine methyltransferase n=1 Tax=Synoicihabitans lomoniglobus TaxID=2909285 RepID=A0AAF0CQJ9_9BACT|nr:peptide chain release factor N(5)-glutamine methyltransferase [Opitutaceae bacterium LMO-M01]WED66236.1 peptide chain release factor N(5)-glutamine methyltransferase [Opitutaceae bacterium LMO-M01]
MISLLEVLQKSAGFLESKGVEHARLNAELLIGHALGLKRMQLYMEFERLLPEAELELIRPMVRRRAQREPLQHIIGSVEFGDVELKVDSRALIPRPETEYLVELLRTEYATTPPDYFADLGTGSGALALALAHAWPDAKAVALDVSAEALALATENREALGLTERVEMLESDWFSAMPDDSRFGLIVANPPYLTTAEVAATAPEVKDHEPAVALSTASDGMDAFEVIISHAATYLLPDGLLAMEAGIAQHAMLVAKLEQAGFDRVESRQDLTGRDRFVFARMPSA